PSAPAISPAPPPPRSSAAAAPSSPRPLHGALPICQPRLGVEGTFGVGQRHHGAAQVHDLARGVLGDVAGAGNGHALAVDAALVAVLEHFLGEVHATEAGGFRTDQAAAVADALAGEHGGRLVGQALVLTVQVAHLASTHANIAGRDVGIGADMAEQLGHEGLAEAHDFGVALALGIEV